MTHVGHDLPPGTKKDLTRVRTIKGYDSAGEPCMEYIAGLKDPVDGRPHQVPNLRYVDERVNLILDRMREINDVLGLLEDPLLELNLISADRLGRLLDADAADAAGAQEATVTTTDATPTTMRVWTLATDTAIVITAHIVAYSAGANEGAGYVRRIAARRESTTATEIGTATPFTREDSGSWDVEFSVVDDTVILTVTGEAATTIKWKTSWVELETD